MYYNLEAELKRKNIKRQDLANFLGVALTTVSDKMQGKSDFSLSVALKIKKWLGGNMPVEELFTNDDDSAA